MKLTRYIPKDAIAVEHAHGIVYTYTQAGRLYAIAYSGKRGKSDWHFRFHTEEQRGERIQKFFASLDAHTQRIAEQRQQRTQPHTLTVGEVIYNTWGYDQTNVDFYEVVKASTNFVWLQRIARDLKETGFMSGQVMPRPGTRHGEITQHRVNVYGSGNSVHFEFGAGCKWDGTPMSCSWYA